MFCCAFHSQRSRAHTLEPCQAHTRKHKQQQQIHYSVKHRLMSLDTVEWNKIFEEYMALQRHPPESEVCHSLDPTHRYEQEPTESQTHVHISQNGIHAEYAAVQQRFTEYLP